MLQIKKVSPSVVGDRVYSEVLPTLRKVVKFPDSELKADDIIAAGRKPVVVNLVGVCQKITFLYQSNDLLFASG